jgi:hypothetical protein
MPILAAAPGKGYLGGFSSWLTGPSALTGDAFDALIAGPKRPPRKEPLRRAVSASRARSASVAASKYRQEAPLRSNLVDAKAASGSAHASARETNEALEEREDHLARLGESLNNLGEGANDLIRSAKRMAAQQTLKNRFF